VSGVCQEGDSQTLSRTVDAYKRIRKPMPPPTRVRQNKKSDEDERWEVEVCECGAGIEHEVMDHFGGRVLKRTIGRSSV